MIMRAHLANRGGLVGGCLHHCIKELQGQGGVHADAATQQVHSLLPDCR